MKIVLSVALAVFLLGCSDDTQNSQTKESATKAPVTTVEKVQASAQKSMDAMQETADKSVAAVQEATQESVTAVKETTAKVVESVQTTTKEVVADVQKEVAPVVKKAQAKVAEVVAPAATSSIDGEKLYKSTCLACHGANAEKKALTKSQVIQGWASTKIEDALHGYKNKTYGGPMKTIMEGKTKDLSDDEMKALANYISKL
ncbi:MAG: c-type cytochrome [Sulfurimonas sp.]